MKGLGGEGDTGKQRERKSVDGQRMGEGEKGDGDRDGEWGGGGGICLKK